VDPPHGALKRLPAPAVTKPPLTFCSEPSRTQLDVLFGLLKNPAGFSKLSALMASLKLLGTPADVETSRPAPLSESPRTVQSMTEVPPLKTI
jgi:hypothetical protein